MKKSLIIILSLVGVMSIVAVVLAIFGVFNLVDIQGVKEQLAVSESAEPTSTPKQMSEPIPEPTPEPTPVPTPVPLGIEKTSELPFSMLAPTTTMTFEELVGDNGNYEEEDEFPPLPPADTYKMVINEYHQMIIVYKKDDAGEFTVPVRYMITTTGSGKLPTPKGEFTMGSKYVRFGLFSSYGVYGQYWRDITGNIFCHSLIYASRNANSYTNSYNQLGKRGSHGCVRLFVPDARWVYYNIAPGTSADIIRGDKDDAETAALKAQLVFPDKPGTRPGLKPGEIPITEAWPGWQGNAYDQYQDYLSSLATDDTDIVETQEGEA